MHLVVIGINHDTAQIELREKVRIPESHLLAALEDLHIAATTDECLLLSTCNRTEIYACTPTREDDAAIIQWIGAYFDLLPESYTPHLYSLAGHKAAEHLFRVATSLDSMVIGEAQILGQVKQAYTVASQGGYTGSLLNALFQQAMAVGKRARTETTIGQGAFSVSSVAVQLAKSIFGELPGHTVLNIGASEMGELTITHLVSNGAQRVLVANRTFARAEELAACFCGEAIPFDELPTALATADIVISSTGSPDPIITRQLVAGVMHQRRGRPLFCIDIAVPRDIEAGVGDIDNVFVYNIDDLAAVVKDDLANRHAEVAKVEQIIAEELGEFTQRLRSLDAVPVIIALRERFEAIHRAELSKLEGKLRHLPPEDLETIRQATRTLINKISHQPMVRMKDIAAREDAAAKLEMICELFGLSPEVEGSEEKPNSE